ncbi:hypothetical protein LOTGIDRAFT_216644 [Lottia gigantea]|uniref:GPN-loop GTPase 2 n=1 Tax=Lottia gigantea TaxID=225164 RepID=V4AGL9_LOTGI|nr:hypothetical protein LOTGIDRAFT_216644 [Lottia gigantea]ESO92561.1 hypothetical protein LOTGIDRAFT_216644 [Lottia gigantea]
MPSFGQIVIGPPATGKTTYCCAMASHLIKKERKVAVVNLDPANDILPYKPAIDIADLIQLSDVMENLKLGPNGALVYCMEYLEKNVDWLLEELSKIKDSYVLFDFPGQVELFTHHQSVKNLVNLLLKADYRLTCVNLIDSFCCNEPGKYISALIISLNTMLQLELPHINILSKFDLFKKYKTVVYNEEFYTDVLDLNFLLDHLQDDPVFKKYKKLNQSLIDVIEGYGLVSFLPLNLQKKESIESVSAAVDKANGFVFDKILS